MPDTQIRRALEALERYEVGRRLAAALIAYGELLKLPELLTAVAELEHGQATRHRLGLSLGDVSRLVDDLGVALFSDGYLRLTELGRDVCEVDDAQHDGAECLWAGAGVHSA